MTVSIGNSEGIFTQGNWSQGSNTPLASFTEVFTEGHWDGSDVAQVPLEYVEILYPIIPVTKNNTLTFRTDKKNWKMVQKSVSKWEHEIITLNIRIVLASYMNTFYQFLENNVGMIVELNLPGVQPFMTTSEINNVYITGFSKPLRDMQKRYSMSITFLKDPNAV